jgi:hypothetical protein
MNSFGRRKTFEAFGIKFCFAIIQQIPPYIKFRIKVLNFDKGSFNHYRSIYQLLIVQSNHMTAINCVVVDDLFFSIEKNLTMTRYFKNSK